jgi:hypothetical protein
VADKVSRGDVIAFRLNAHNLTERLAEQGLLDAAGSCGVQNSPPGSALLALHARVRDLTRDQVEKAVGEDKSLLQTWCMRGSPFYFPAADAPVFTTGVLPPTEKALSHFVVGVEQVLDMLGLSITDAVVLAGDEIDTVLSGRQLAINELGGELASRVARRLSAKQRALWEGKGPWGAGQPLGEGVVHFCVRILSEYTEDFDTSSCEGTGGYSDMTPGTAVTVADSTGNVVATGALGEGRDLGTGCDLTFDVPGVPAGLSEYVVTVSHRGSQVYSYQRAQQPIELTLGG